MFYLLAVGWYRLDVMRGALPCVLGRRTNPAAQISQRKRCLVSGLIQSRKQGECLWRTEGIDVVPGIVFRVQCLQRTGNAGETFDQGGGAAQSRCGHGDAPPGQALRRPTGVVNDKDYAKKAVEPVPMPLPTYHFSVIRCVPADCFIEISTSSGRLPMWSIQARNTCDADLHAQPDVRENDTRPARH